MSDTRYPYKIRAVFTARQEAGLRVAAERYEVGITEMIRRYVAQGLVRDDITGTPPAPMPGQTAIDQPSGGEE